MTQRSGSSGGTNTITSVFWQVDPSGTKSYGGYTRHELQSVERSSFVGQDIKDYHKRKRKGELLPFTSWHQVERSGTATGAWDTYWNSNTNSDQYRYYYDSLYCHGRDWDTLMTNEDDVSSLVDDLDMNYQDLVNAAAARIQSNAFDALTFTVELRKSAQLVASICSRIIKFLKTEALRGNLKSLWADVFLEFSYGWRPLIRELQQLTGILQGTGREMERYKERVGIGFSGSSNSENVFTWNYQTCTGGISRRSSWSISARASIVADISVPELSFNPAATAWERTKLSFVVDWVLNVGQWIEQTSFLMYASKHYAAIGFQIEHTQNEYTDWVNPKTTSGGYYSVAKASYEATVKTKVTIRKPHSGVNLKLSTGQNNRIRISQLQTLTSLIGQRL